MYLERQAEKARAKQAAVQAVYDNLKLQGVNVPGDGQVVDVSDDSYGDSKDSEDSNDDKEGLRRKLILASGGRVRDDEKKSSELSSSNSASSSASSATKG